MKKLRDEYCNFMFLQERSIAPDLIFFLAYWVVKKQKASLGIIKKSLNNLELIMLAPIPLKSASKRLVSAGDKRRVEWNLTSQVN